MGVHQWGILSVISIMISSWWNEPGGQRSIMERRCEIKGYLFFPSQITEAIKPSKVIVKSIRFIMSRGVLLRFPEISEKERKKFV